MTPELKAPSKRRVMTVLEHPEGVERVYLPPPHVLQQLLPVPPPLLEDVPEPEPVPTPTPDGGPNPDRHPPISVGPPITRREEGPLILRRDDDLTAVPKGVPNPGEPAPRKGSESGRAKEIPGRQGARLPPGVPDPPGEAQRETRKADGSIVGEPTRSGADERDAAKGRPIPQGLTPESGEDGERRRGVADGSSIGSSLRNLERQLGTRGPLGLESGTGQQMGPLFFDPQGADFTAWYQHFKNEVYRNWIIPQPAIMGFGGHVDFEFTVERDGTISALRTLKSSGTRALDRAAQNALLGSRLLPLPADYGPPRVTMQVGFYYLEASGRS